MSLTSYAADLGDVPVSVAAATDGGKVPLDESPLTLVPHQSVYFVPLAHLSKGARVLHDGGLAAGHWRHSQGEKCVNLVENLNIFFYAKDALVPAALAPVPFLHVKVRW